MKTKDELKQEVAQTGLREELKQLFYNVIDTANVATLSEEEQMRYESNLKNYMDTMSCIRFAKEKGMTEGYEQGKEKGREEGRAEGREEGTELGRMSEKLEIAKSMKSDKIDIEVIAKYTNLPISEIEKL